MQSKIEKHRGLARTMTVEVPSTVLEDKVEKGIARAGRTLKLDGFRKGKVPIEVIRDRYEGAIRAEVVEDLLRETYQQAVAEQQLEPAGSPQLTLLKGAQSGDLVYQAKFDVYPEIRLARLSSVKIKRPLAKVTDADVEEFLDGLRRDKGTWVAAEHPARDGDRVTLDFAGSIAGEPFAGGTAKDFVLELGAGRMVAGFEKALVGLSPGEEKTFPVTFPQDYPGAELAGKEASFQVALKKVEAVELPVAEDAFAATVAPDITTLAELRQRIREQLEARLERARQDRTRERLFDALLAAHKFELPAALLEEEISAMRQQFLARIGSPADQEDDGQKLPRELFRDKAEQRVRLGLILKAVARDGKVQLDDERLRRLIERASAGRPAGEFRPDRQQLAALSSMAMEEQLVEWLLARVKVKDEPCSSRELLAPSGDAKP